MAPRRKSNRARKLDDEDDETSEYPMDVDSESGDMDELPEDVEEDEDLMEQAVNEEEEEEDEPEEPTADGSSPQRKKPKTSSTGPKKVKLTPYQKRFGQVSEAGGLELEDIEDDFIDEKGEAKVTKDGELVGERQYRVPTFTLPRHPTKLYMLLVDIAKATGFKDSFSFLIKNHDFPRLVATEADREKLIELDLIPYQLKNRTIGLVTARSIFRRFGYKIIKRGRSIRDDYLVGDREEPPEVDESLKKGLDLTKALTLELKREVAAEIYTNFPYRKTDVGNRNTDDLPEFEAPTGLTLDNWMYRATLSAAEFNRKLNMTRPKLFWDPHTNIEHVPQISQPTVTRLEMSRGPQDPAFGHVVNDVNVDGLDLENWEPVVQTEKSRKYPIALVAGQRQYAFAVHTERFGYQKPVYIAPPLPPQPQIPRLEPSTSMEDLEQSSNPKKRIKTTDNICGAKTMAGNICQRTVLAVGERCAQHSRLAQREADEEADEESVDDQLCTHCQQDFAPEEALDLAPEIPSDLLIECDVCDSKHHPGCIEIKDPVLVCKIQNYDWHCSNCKLCSECNKEGDDDKLLFCDLCDRGYHTFCLKPPLSSLPEGTWLCDLCAVCTSCHKMQERNKKEIAWKHIIVPPEERTNKGLGTYLCTYCKDCEKHFNADRFCPLCLGTYAADADEFPMAACDSCDRWIHVGCDPGLTKKVYEELTENSKATYSCVLCDRKKLNSFMTEVQKKSPRSRKTFKYKGHTLVSPPLAQGVSR